MSPDSLQKHLDFLFHRFRSMRYWSFVVCLHSSAVSFDVWIFKLFFTLIALQKKKMRIPFRAFQYIMITNSKYYFNTVVALAVQVRQRRLVSVHDGMTETSAVICAKMRRILNSIESTYPWRYPTFLQ